MAEKKYIDTEAAIDAIRNLYPGIPLVKVNLEKWHEQNRDFMACETAIEHIPAADVRPVVRAVWRRYSLFTDTYECSNCGEQVIDQQFRTNFCPNCGTDMRKADG